MHTSFTDLHHTSNTDQMSSPLAHTTDWNKDLVLAEKTPTIEDLKARREAEFFAIGQIASQMFEEPDHSKTASKRLAQWIQAELNVQGVYTFSDSIELCAQMGLANERLVSFVKRHKLQLDQAITNQMDERFEYFGLRTVYDRYLLKHPTTRLVVEGPQYFFMRVACALSVTVDEAIELYGMYANFEFLSSSPTLFNAGTKHEQLSSCFLLDSPDDSLVGIYDKYKDAALLSKFSGGIGLSFSRVRSRGSLIKGTNGFSNGIIPWLKTLDSSVAAVNQGGKRKGACCVYLETWHADIEEFLELRDNTGDDQRRTHNLNIANWIPDLFMDRVEKGLDWSLFDPKDVPELVDTFGDEFQTLYIDAEAKGLARKTVPARDLYSRMIKTLAQTGNGWMTFKDQSNKKCNQTGHGNRTVHLSNLCTEILEVTSSEETAVCNLGSINLPAYVKPNGDFDWNLLSKNVRVAVRHLDRVIDLNFYPIETAKGSNKQWRPIGLGVMGLQDLFFLKGWAFDSVEAREFNKKVQEEIYFSALESSCELAERVGPHETFFETRAAKGHLQFDLWNVVPSNIERWTQLKAKIKKTGLRNSLMIAIAPTATIGSIVGSYECIEPQVSNLFKKETLSGEFLQVNRYLVRSLKKIGLWNESIRSKIKSGEGSIQAITEIPEEIRKIYRTAWEVPMRSLIDMARDRGAYIDQGQSLNLFVESPSVGVLSSMYMYAWKQGLKTTYYLRSRPATKIAKVASNADNASAHKIDLSNQSDDSVKAAMACSLENPESCESCQ